MILTAFCCARPRLDSVDQCTFSSERRSDSRYPVVEEKHGAFETPDQRHITVPVDEETLRAELQFLKLLLGKRPTDVVVDADIRAILTLET